MIQELFFVPHSQSRSNNQVNTSVTLRYNTKTEELQLVDIFGNVKKLNIDTTPDLEIEDLSTIITVDYIKNLGFNTADQIDADIPKYDAGWGIGIDKDEENKDIFFVKKDIMSSFFIDCLSGNEDTQQNIKDIINLDYISGLGFVLSANDKDTIYSGQSGITVEEIDGVNKIFLEPGFLSATLTGLGFVPHDFDTYYYADEDLIHLDPVETEVESGTLIKPTFTVNKENLSTWVGTYLTENQYVNTQDAPVTLSAGDGIDIQVQEVGEGLSTNLIALTAHIPVINEGEGISVTEENGDYTVALTAHIPSAINDVWTDEANSGYIRSLGYAITGDLVDTKYTNGPSLTLSTDYSNQNIFNVNEQWLDTFIKSYNYIISAANTEYTGSDSIEITGADNSISIKNSWVSENIPPLVTYTIGTAAGQSAVKSVVSKDYISGLGFVLAGEQKDTTYTNGDGLDLTSTTFSVNTNWLSNKISAFIDENVTSTWLSGTGIAISDTSCVSGMGILIEQIANEDPVWKTQKVSVSIDWLTGFLQVYNFDHGITGKHEIAVGDGLGITINDETKIDTIALTAAIPSSLATLDSISANTNYISSLGFVLAGDDKDTKYGVVANGGLTVDTDHNFAIDTNWMDNRVSSFITSAALPTKVSELNNDMSFVTAADLEAVRLSLMQQFANLTLVVDIDGDVETPNQNIYIETDTPVTDNTTFTGKNITVTKLSNSNSYVKFNSTGDVSISKLSSSGNLAQNAENGNTQIAVNTSGRVVITDSTLAQTGYNAIEIGLDPSVEPPKSVVIDNVKFDGTLTNNAISIFGTADEAVVTISKCDFTHISNALRISNRTNCKVTINLINCTFGTWESGEYGGPILCQDYTSTTAGEVVGLNRFAPEKVTINMIGCTHNGNPIVFDDPATVCGTGDANQLLYLYAKIAGGLIAYDAAKFPKFSAK